MRENGGHAVALKYSMKAIYDQVQRIVGKTGLNVLNRILGVILSALAVQFIFDGLLQSGLLK